MQGMDSVKRLRAGPDIASYRGLSIVHSRSFSMEPGTPPRDILRRGRRVRVAEYYRILPSSKNANRQFQFYDEERDTWATFSFSDSTRKNRAAAAAVLVSHRDRDRHGDAGPVPTVTCAATEGHAARAGSESALAFST
jgi:hypothetical protein